MTHHVAYCTPMDPGGQERARRRCLAGLIWALRDVGVSDLVLETRHQHDAADRSFLEKELQHRRLPRGLSYQFGAPLQEPLPWAADAVAGAVSWAQSADGDPRYLAALGHTVRLIQLDGFV